MRATEKSAPTGQEVTTEGTYADYHELHSICSSTDIVRLIKQRINSR
jgi:hypothetical protein